ncbi:lysophospholipid acyltransferase family protein [Microlunatus ginsengisoli]|uniref:Lysophospholipid acyltransferase family protein n=1 Tax=Microlunatus ginsengisoli TaxID=363863 RepID=A0ABP6ZM75_9ACTN
MIGISPGTPHTDRLSPAGTLPFRLARPAVAAALRTYWRVGVHDQAYVPRSGPVVLATNHVGVLDGPLLAAVTERPSFALVKKEMYDGGAVGWLLTRFGQIPIDRHAVDPTAIRRAIRVLRDDGVLVVFPEGVRGTGEVHWAKGGAVYLAMVTGAPIVPVALIGTRDPGQDRDETPHRGAAVHVVYGRPFTVPRLPWPRPKALVAEHTERLRRILAEHVVEAQARTGLTLPGPPRPTTIRQRQ